MWQNALVPLEFTPYPRPPQVKMIAELCRENSKRIFFLNINKIGGDVFNFTVNSYAFPPPSFAEFIRSHSKLLWALLLLFM